MDYRPPALNPRQPAAAGGATASPRAIIGRGKRDAGWGARSGPRKEEASAAAQLLERDHDSLAIGRALLQALIPGGKPRQRRPLDLHLVIAVEGRAVDEIRHGEPVAKEEGPALQQPIEDGIALAQRLDEARDGRLVALLRRCAHHRVEDG